MAREKSNSELVKEFFKAEREKGRSYYSRVVVHGYSPRTLVYWAIDGQNGRPVFGNWLKERIREWLTASGEVRTDKQLINLTKAVIANVPHSRPLTKV